jgi:hypothetical protein
VWVFVRLDKCQVSGVQYRYEQNKGEKNVQTIVLQWSTGASKKQNVRTIGKQKRIDTLYERHNDGVINSSQLLTGLPYLIGNKI